jgi:hypothetical protein
LAQLENGDNLEKSEKRRKKSENSENLKSDKTKKVKSDILKEKQKNSDGNLSPKPNKKRKLSAASSNTTINYAENEMKKVRMENNSEDNAVILIDEVPSDLYKLHVESFTDLKKTSGWKFEEGKEFICAFCGEEFENLTLLGTHVSNQEPGGSCYKPINNNLPVVEKMDTQIQNGTSNDKSQNSSVNNDSLESKSEENSQESEEDSSEKFPCPHCSVEPFKDNDELKKHIEFRHQIKCKYCGPESQIFQTRGFLNVHYKESHPERWAKIRSGKSLKPAAPPSAPVAPPSQT